MIYVDSSVLLAALFQEDRRPAPSFWSEDLVSSRLLDYEVWVAVHRNHREGDLGEGARHLTSRVELVEMTPTVLARSKEPFPASVRSLDALHLATADYLRAQGHRVALATYDARLRDAARAMKLELAEP